MRLLVRDIDSIAVTPADLSDIDFEGSPGRAEVASGGSSSAVDRVKSASLDRAAGEVARDSRFDLSEALAPPCDATVRWRGGTAWLHVVSYHYCSLDEVLDYGDEQRLSPRALDRDEADAFAARARAEAVCESICGQTFRATWKSEPCSDFQTHQMGWPASSISTPGWRLMADGIARRTAPGGPGEISYVAGTDAGVPPDLRAAIAQLAASYLMVSTVPDRAVYASTGDNMMRFTLADAGSTGIPDVDAVLARHTRSRMAIL